MPIFDEGSDINCDEKLVIFRLQITQRTPKNREEQMKTQSCDKRQINQANIEHAEHTTRFMWFGFNKTTPIGALNSKLLSKQINNARMFTKIILRNFFKDNLTQLLSIPLSINLIIHTEN